MDTRCPHCGALYEVEQNECGSRVRCEICGKSFVVDTAVCQTTTTSRVKRPFWSISGRANRKEYLGTLLKVGLLTVVLMVIIMKAVDAIVPGGWGIEIIMLLGAVVKLVFCIVFAPASIRRLHDMNGSGDRYIIVASLTVIFPFLGVILGMSYLLFLACRKGTHGKNGYDDKERDEKDREDVKATTIGCVVLILLMFSLPLVLWLIDSRTSAAVEKELSAKDNSACSPMPSAPSFAGIRNLEDVFKEGNIPDEDYLYEYSGHGDLRIQQVVLDPPRGVFATQKGSLKSVFIKMDNIDGLADDDPMPPVMVKCTGVFRYKTVLKAEKTVRAFEVVSEYKIISEDE